MTTIKHGTRTTYTYRKCRCPACRAANTAYKHVADAQRRQRTPPEGSHGRAHTYSNWGCRCDPCTAANTKASAERRARQKGNQQP